MSKSAPGVNRLKRRDILQNIVKYTGKPRYRQMSKQCITGIPTTPMFHNEVKLQPRQLFILRITIYYTAADRNYRYS